MTIYNNNQNQVILPPASTKRDGFADYNNSSSSFPIPPDFEIELVNDKNGENTNTDFLPDGVIELMDGDGYLNFSELDLGDVVTIRNDFFITPSASFSTCFLTFELGFGDPNSFKIVKQLPRFIAGGGVQQRVITNELIYIGNDLVRNNPCRMLISCTSSSEVLNNGVAIAVNKRG